MAFWSGKRVLVTGGASFIGSHLVDRLVESGAEVKVVDDLSSGRFANIERHVAAGDLEFVEADLRDTDVVRRALAQREVVFHIAADHGGRGYVELHQAGPASNLYLDGLVFYEALRAGTGKVVFASSGCVYPNAIQSNPDEVIYLTEDLVKPPYDADNLYGWAKLMGELTLRAYAKEHGLASASCRYFTAYGPRSLESHAIMAMLGRAALRQDPFEIWGDGTQIRNWTYIDDIVSGTLLAAERVDDGTAVNLGTMERVRVLDAAKEVLRLAGYNPEIRFLPDMPTGPLNRVADNAKARQLLDWEPQVNFLEGLSRTMEWYLSSRGEEEIRRALTSALTER